MTVGEDGGLSGSEGVRVVSGVTKVGCMIHTEGSNVKLATSGVLSALDSVFDSLVRLPVWVEVP